MSLKQFLKKTFEKLADSFNHASTLPEPEIQKEMEAEGWKFDTYVPLIGGYHGIMMPIVFVINPEGRPACNGNADPADTAHFEKVVAQKRLEHGLKP